MQFIINLCSIVQYGFTKIRKGPEIDMYFNPGFIRGEEDGLSQLRKRAKAPVKKNRVLSSLPLNLQHATRPRSFSLNFEQSFRVISPTISTCASSCNGHNSDVSSETSARSLCGPSQSIQTSERLTMLANAMVMMIDG